MIEAPRRVKRGRFLFLTAQKISSSPVFRSPATGLGVVFSRAISGRARALSRSTRLSRCRRERKTTIHLRHGLIRCPPIPDYATLPLGRASLAAAFHAPRTCSRGPAKTHFNRSRKSSRINGESMNLRAPTGSRPDDEHIGAK